MSDRRPNHDRITRGVPFGNQPAEDPCPGPVDAREWTPEPHEVYPAGQWECVSIMSGNKSEALAVAVAALEAKRAELPATRTWTPGEIAVYRALAKIEALMEDKS